MARPAPAATALPMTPLDDDDLDLRLLLARRGLASRAEAWPALLGVQALRETEPPSYYAELVCMVDEAPTRTDHFIWLDLSRTGHPKFDAVGARQELMSVLAAYARRCPARGWHPERVMLAARLLLEGCDAETTFWCLVAVIETMPGGADLLGQCEPDDAGRRMETHVHRSSRL